MFYGMPSHNIPCGAALFFFFFNMNANLWFRNWASGNGQKLSNVQIKRLVTLTRKWRNNISSENLRVWTSNTSAEFWGFEPFRTESAWVRECLEIKVPTFEDHDGKPEDCEKALVRRRVLLIILCDIIQREVARLRASFEAQPHKFLSTAARNIVEQAYPGEYDKKLYDKCIHLQRYGQRYLLLAKRELVLTPLYGASTK